MCFLSAEALEGLGRRRVWGGGGCLGMTETRRVGAKRCQQGGGRGCNAAAYIPKVVCPLLFWFLSRGARPPWVAGRAGGKAELMGKRRQETVEEKERGDDKDSRAKGFGSHAGARPVATRPRRIDTMAMWVLPRGSGCFSPFSRPSEVGERGGERARVR